MVASGAVGGEALGDGHAVAQAHQLDLLAVGWRFLFGPAGGPEEDACHMESGQVDGCGLLVAGGDPTPLFQVVDAPLDGVALLLGLAIVGLRPASPVAPSQPVASLVLRDRDHRSDAALAGSRLGRALARMAGAVVG